MMLLVLSPAAARAEQAVYWYQLTCVASQDQCVSLAQNYGYAFWKTVAHPDCMFQGWYYCYGGAAAR